MEQPLGPHQVSSSSLSLQAFQTRGRGASKTRRITKAPSALRSPAGIGLPLAGCALSCLQMSIESVEARVPEVAVGLKPVRQVLERSRLQSPGSRLRRAT